MAEFSDAKMDELAKLLSENGIKFQKGFPRVMDADFSDDPSKYEVVCEAVDRIGFLARECVNHGLTGEKQKDIFTLSKICVDLTQKMKSKKVDAMRDQIHEISCKEYKGKNTIDVKRDLLNLVRDTADGIGIVLQNESMSRWEAFYGEVKEYLVGLAEQIDGCYDNYSLEASACSRAIAEIVYRDIRLPIGSGILTLSNFRESKEALDGTMKKWKNLLRAGQKPAQPENTYGFDPKFEDSFRILVRTNDFLEKLDILKAKVEDYRDQTDFLCDVSEEQQEREELKAEIAALNAELAENMARVENKRMTVDEALARAEQINARKERIDLRLTAIDQKVQARMIRRDSRNTIYTQVKEAARSIEANRKNPTQLYIYTELIDLEKITRLLTDAAKDENDLRSLVDEIKRILQADQKTLLHEIRAGTQIDTIVRNSGEKLNDALAQMRKEYETATQKTARTRQEESEEQKLEKLRKLSGGVTSHLPSGAGDLTKESDEHESLLKTK